MKIIQMRKQKKKKTSRKNQVKKMGRQKSLKRRKIMLILQMLLKTRIQRKWKQKNLKQRLQEARRQQIMDLQISPVHLQRSSRCVHIVLQNSLYLLRQQLIDQSMYQYYIYQINYRYIQQRIFISNYIYYALIQILKRLMCEILPLLTSSRKITIES